MEIRSLDINVFDPAGINQNTMRFMEAFVIYCLLEESPFFDAVSFGEVQQNQSLTAKRGRDPVLELMCNGRPVLLSDWAREIVGKVGAVAELIDRQEGGHSYSDAVALMASYVDNPDNTPSARVLEELREANCSFFDFALEVSRGHKKYFDSITPMPNERALELEREAVESLQRQRDIEAADDISFEEYLAHYFAAD